MGFALREHLVAASLFAVANLWQMTPIVLAGLLVTTFLTATGSIGVLVATFDTRELTDIVVVSLIGAVLPVCGITVLPLVAGLLGGRGGARAGDGFPALIRRHRSADVRDHAWPPSVAALRVAARGLGERERGLIQKSRGVDIVNTWKWRFHADLGARLSTLRDRITGQGR